MEARGEQTVSHVNVDSAASFFATDYAAVRIPKKVEKALEDKSIGLYDFVASSTQSLEAKGIKRGDLQKAQGYISKYVKTYAQSRGGLEWEKELSKLKLSEMQTPSGQELSDRQALFKDMINLLALRGVTLSNAYTLDDEQLNEWGFAEGYRRELRNSLSSFLRDIITKPENKT